MIHARLSPSGANRWMQCTASVGLIDLLMSRGELKESDLEDDLKEQVTEDELLEQNISGYGDVILDPGRESTSYAAEGTVMHSVRADCLTFGMDPYEFVGQTLSADGFSFQITEDMVDHLVAGIDWINESTGNPHVEEKVDLGEWLPGNYGFCDTYWVTGETLFVSDLKFGQGDPVRVDGNRQLRLYALGAWAALGKPAVEHVTMNIDQPRAGGMKFWTITFDELMEFALEAVRVYGRVTKGDVEFVPTTLGCKYCPVRKSKRGCAAFNKWHLWMIGAAVMDPSNPEPKFRDPEQMPRAQRYYIVHHAPAIRSWLTKLHEESLNAAIEGDPDPGSKAIEGGEGRRFLTDPEAAAEIVERAIGDRAYNKKLIGFTEIDKLMKPGKRKVGFPKEYAELQELVDRKEATAKLVPTDHPAPAYVRAVEDDFEDQDDDLEDEFDEEDL